MSDVDLDAVATLLTGAVPLARAWLFGLALLLGAIVASLAPQRAPR